MKTFVLAVIICTPLCLCAQQSVSRLGPVSAATNGSDISLVATGIQYHQVVWFDQGTVSSCTLTVDSSADGSSYSAGGIVPSQTCTSSGSSAFFNVVSGHARISVGTISGGGTVTVVYIGYASLPAYTTVISNIPATADTGNGATSASTLRVTVSNDSTGQIKTTNFPAAVDTNTGNAGASTIRFALATNQPNLTTPFNVQGPSTQGAAPSGGQIRICATDGTNCQDLKVDSGGALLVSGQSTKATYSGTQNGFSPGAASDIAGLCGSNTKTVRLTYFAVSGTATAASAVNIALVKRSTADTSGGLASDTAVPNDANNAAATASLIHFTSGPSTGTSIGNVRSLAITLSTSAGAIPAVWYQLPLGVENDQEIVLRGAASCVYLTQGSNPTGESLGISWEWTEE